MNKHEFEARQAAERAQKRPRGDDEPPEATVDEFGRARSAASLGASGNGGGGSDAASEERAAQAAGLVAALPPRVS